MSSDGDRDSTSTLEHRLARMVEVVDALGESLDDIPEVLTEEWLSAQEAHWATLSSRKTLDAVEPEAPTTEASSVHDEEMLSGQDEEGTPPIEDVASAVSTAIAVGASEASAATEDVVIEFVSTSESESAESSNELSDSDAVSSPNHSHGPLSEDEQGLSVFLPNRAELVAFSAYALAGSLWAGVLALELVQRESVDGIRGVIVLSFCCSVILGVVVRREFHRPKDLSGPQGEIRFLREGLTLGMSGILGTAAGVGVGLGASGTDLGSVIGWGASLGSGLGFLLIAVVLFMALNGALRHGGRKRSWLGFGVLAAMGSGLLAVGAMHIQEIMGLVDSFADAQDQAEQFLDDAVGDKADMPKHSADWVTTLAVSPLPDLFRVVLRQLYVFNLAVTAIFLGLGTWLSARLMMTKDWPKRLGQSITASIVVGYGLIWLSAALALGTLMSLDAAFLQVGSGPNEMKSEFTVLLGVLLITAGSGVNSGVRHLAAGRRHLKKNL